jgi:hypothetical protein
VATVLGVLAPLGPAFAQSFQRFSLETTASIDHFTNDAAATRPQIIFDIAATVRIGAGWDAYVRPWFRLPRNPSWDAMIYQAAVRYQRQGPMAVRVDAGQIASPIGLGMLDTSPSVNPLIGPHMSYFVPMMPFNTGGPRVLAVASTYPLGVVASLSGKRWDARVAMVESTPTRIHTIGGATKPVVTGVIEAGAGFTPTVGLRVGVSMAHGAYLKSDEIRQPNAGDRSVTMFGVEGEYAFGYTKLSGEWIRDRFETSFTPVDANTWFIQGMHTLSPRWYVAGRREATYAPARFTGDILAAQPDLNSAEVTVGYRVTPEITLKASWASSRFYGARDWTQHAGFGVVWNRRWW